MEFGCSLCEYTSEQRRHVERHINKKKSCGTGIKEIIEIPIEIICEYCNKKFASKETMKTHIKNNCKQKDAIKDNELIKLKEENERLKMYVINKISTRTEARKIYKNHFKKLECVHCGNKNESNIQICHIKPVKDFVTTEE